MLYGYGPERLIIGRFEPADVDRLPRAAWWDWPVDLITTHARTIMTGTPADIERIAIENGLAQPV